MTKPQPARIHEALDALAEKGLLAQLPKRLRRFCAVPDCEREPQPTRQHCDEHSPEPKENA